MQKTVIKFNIMKHFLFCCVIMRFVRCNRFCICHRKTWQSWCVLKHGGCSTLSKNFITPGGRTSTNTWRTNGTSSSTTTQGTTGRKIYPGGPFQMRLLFMMPLTCACCLELWNRQWKSTDLDQESRLTSSWLWMQMTQNIVVNLRTGLSTSFLKTSSTFVSEVTTLRTWNKAPNISKQRSKSFWKHGQIC